MLSATELGRTYRKYLLEVEKKANEQIKSKGYELK